MKIFALLLFFFFILGCVDEVSIDPESEEKTHPIPCFQSVDTNGCENSPIPMPSDFAAMGLPDDATVINDPQSPFSVKMSSDPSEDNIDQTIVLLKNGEQVSSDNYTINVDHENFTISITPTAGSWESGQYSVILLNGLTNIEGTTFTQPLAFYFAMMKDPLVDSEGKSLYPDLFDDEKGGSLEMLRQLLSPVAEQLEAGLGVDRSDIILFWSITIDNSGVFCLNSSLTKCLTTPNAPLPSDFVMKYENDGTQHLNLPIDPNSSEDQQMLVAGINTLDGWGVSNPFFIYSNVAIDSETIDTDLSDGSASIMVMKFGEGGAPTPVDVIAISDVESKRLTIVPTNKVWDENSKYSVVITDDLKGVDGETLKKDTPFSLMSSTNSLVDGEGNSLYSGLDNETAQQLEMARLMMDQAYTGLGMMGIMRDDVVMMYTVTTQKVTNELLSLVLNLSNGNVLDPDPQTPAMTTIAHDAIPGTLSMFGIDIDQYAAYHGYNSGEELYEDVEYMIMGSFKSPSYQAESGIFDPEKIANGDQFENLSFYLSIPRTSSENSECSEMPEGGFPVILFQHGLGMDKNYMLILANQFAKRCYATVAIDAVEHGDRETEGGEFLSTNVFKTRDNIRQTIIDMVQTRRAIQAMGSDNYTQLPEGIELDSSKIGYFGISLGGILGTIFMSVDPVIKTGVLNVPGGGLMNILMLSDEEAINGEILEELAASGLEPGTAAFDQFLFMAQLVLDKADPLGYCSHTILDPLSYIVDGADPITLDPKNILIQKAHNDSVVNNATTDHLGVSMGVFGTDNFKEYIDPDGDDTPHTFISFISDEGEAGRVDMFQFYNENLGE